MTSAASLQEDTRARLIALEAAVAAVPAAKKVVSGRVATDGTTVSGADFTSSAGDAGIYGLVFSPAFVVTPACVASSNSPGHYATCAPTSVSAVSVRVYDADGALTSAGFSFIARDA